MSLKSWKKEFYSPISRCSKANALEHSIKKWEGALPENLEKHGCRYDSGRVWCTTSVDYFWFDAYSCALCKKFCDLKLQNVCEKCPIVKLTGKACCDVYETSFDNPQPMLNLLYRVKALRDADKS